MDITKNVFFLPKVFLYNSSLKMRATSREKKWIMIVWFMLLFFWMLSENCSCYLNLVFFIFKKKNCAPIMFSMFFFVSCFLEQQTVLKNKPLIYDFLRLEQMYHCIISKIELIMNNIASFSFGSPNSTILILRINKNQNLSTLLIF